MGVRGFEPRTSALSELRSNQLSYTPGVKPRRFRSEASNRRVFSTRVQVEPLTFIGHPPICSGICCNFCFLAVPTQFDDMSTNVELKKGDRQTGMHQEDLSPVPVFQPVSFALDETKPPSLMSESHASTESFLAGRLTIHVRNA